MTPYRIHHCLPAIKPLGSPLHLNSIVLRYASVVLLILYSPSELDLIDDVVREYLSYAFKEPQSLDLVCHLVDTIYEALADALC